MTTYTSALVPQSDPDNWREVRLEEAYVISQAIVPYVPQLPELYVAPGGVVPAQHPADYVTMTGLMDAISEGPQSHDGTRKGRGRAPMWALVSLFSGLVLVGASMVGWAWLSMQ